MKGLHKILFLLTYWFSNCNIAGLIKKLLNEQCLLEFCSNKILFAYACSILSKLQLTLKKPSCFNKNLLGYIIIKKNGLFL